jgi:hypothetical protein
MHIIVIQIRRDSMAGSDEAKGNAYCEMHGVNLGNADEEQRFQPAVPPFPMFRKSKVL